MNPQRRRVLGATAAATVLPRAAAASSQPSSAKRAPRTLRLAFELPETRFDPAQTQGDINTRTVLGQILESPLTYDFLARPVALLPQTAQALPEISADGRVFTLRIQGGIFFADDPAFKGQRRELTAADYVYSWKRIYDPRFNSSDLQLFEASKIVGLGALREAALRSRKPFDYDHEVEGLRSLDRYTLRITLETPNPRFAYLLADPSLTGAVAREVVEHYGVEAIGDHPVGTGPFCLSAWRRGSRIELSRSPSYRRVVYQGRPADDPRAQAIAARLKDRPLPLVDAVHIDIVEEAQPRWLSFLQGDFHWMVLPSEFAPTAAPNGQLAPYLARKGLRLERQMSAGIIMSFFNMEDPVVGGYAPERVALRRAVALAFDGPAYLARAERGQAVLAQSTIPPFTSGYDPRYKSEMSEFDPARARALLDLYGWHDRDGDGFRETPDGKPFALRLASRGSQRARLANELWQRSMAAVGIRMSFEVATWPELLKKARAGTLMMWGYAWPADSPDGGFFLGIGYGPNKGDINDARFDLPAFNALFEQQLQLHDGPERWKAMRQAQNLMLAYMPYKVHGHGIVNDLVSPQVQNYWRHPFKRDFWRYIEVLE